MATRRRPRPGSLHRPINAGLYRASWLLAAVAVVVLALTTERPQALPAPALPPTFDAAGAARLAVELASTYPDRSPGSPGSLGAWRWLLDRLGELGLSPDSDLFSATIPGRGRVELRNLVTVIPGRTADAIVVMAHRDTLPGGPGADDNASGTAALIELARAYATPTARAATGGLAPIHTLIFLSTDAGAFGGLGARRFARSSPYAPRTVAAINLDAVSSPGQPRLEIAGEGPRSPSSLLVGTAAARLREQTGRGPARTTALGQLIDLAFPYSLYEQAPLLARGIPTITITTRGARPPDSRDHPSAIDVARLGQVGRAAQALLSSLDTGAELVGGTAPTWYVAGRAARGFALRLLLLAVLVPFLVSVVDLLARCRRRGIPLAPALRSLRSRLLFWLWAGALFYLFGFLDVWPGGTPAPVSPSTQAAGHWPRLGLAGYIVLLAVSWLVARDRLVPRRRPGPEEELAGQVGALLLLALVALVASLANTFLLLFLLPSLHAWLWLAQVRRSRPAARLSLAAVGLAGPALLVGSFAVRFRLGLDSPWYLAELTAIGYIPVVTVFVFLAWLAAAAQLFSIEAGRYAPYPGRAELRPGPLRRSLRTLARARSHRLRSGR